MVAQGWKQLGLVAVALAAACSEDADCRDNEVRKRGQCVPSSTTEPPGEAGAGGELSPNAGAENGGSDASGAGGDGGAGGARGGVGGDGGIGGDGGTPNVDGSARWLVFDDSTLYAYDVSRFPAKVPVALVGESSPIWSPDGRWLASFDSSDSNWVVRDMSGAEPGTAIVLGNGANLSRAAALAWSADSRSVSLTSSSRLFVLDPTAGEDSQREVTSTLKIDSGPFWAPRGNKLAYIDEAGSHVIDVAGGVPSEPAAVELTWNMEWSPTGLALVEAFEDQLVYTDLSGPEPVLTELGDHGSDFAFSADGSWLRAGYLFAPLLPQPDAMRLPYDALPPDAHVEWAGWSGDGTWLLYRTYEPLEPESEIVLNYAVKVSGTTADAPILVPDDVSMEGVQWLPDGHRFLDGWQLRDMNDPNVVTSIPHDSAYDASAAIAPTGDRLAYLNTASDVLHIVDLSGATPEELEVPLTDTLNQPLLPPTWSPDGDFIMTHWGLIQIKDGEASAPRLIGSQFPSFSAFAWQPSR